MTGRIYDPLLGRFLSADLVVQAPGNLQSYNRYSYVFNNPLSLTDPSRFNAAVLVEGAELLLELSPELAEALGVGAHATGTGLNITMGGRGDPVTGPSVFAQTTFNRQMMQMAKDNAPTNQTANNQQAADKKTTTEGDRQSTNPKPAVDQKKVKEKSSGGQMDPDPNNKDPKKANKDKMAEVREKGKEGEAQQQTKITKEHFPITQRHAARPASSSACAPSGVVSSPTG